MIAISSICLGFVAFQTLQSFSAVFNENTKQAVVTDMPTHAMI